MSHIALTAYKTAEKALCEPDLKQALYDEGAILMDRVLVTLHGEEHRARRMLEMRVFRRDFFRRYEHEIIPGIFEETLSHFRKQGSADVVDFGYRVMVYLAVAFAGVDRPEKTTEEFETLLRYLKVFGKAATLGQAKGDREAAKAEIRAALDEFDERFFTPSVERRKELIAQVERGELDEEDLPMDVLTVLLRNEDDIELTRDMVMREVAFFFLAGAHTSVHSLGHAMHHLMTWCEEHPQDRAALEADRALVQRFVHESFRLHPSSPIALRRALSETAFLNGERAAVGDTVEINLQAANRDPEIFGDAAAEFDPYRELPAGVPETGITFGIGVHACLGKNLAAGALVREGEQVDPARRQYGMVALIAHGLLKAGARKDPAREAHLDTTIARETWAEYPILLG